MNDKLVTVYMDLNIIPVEIVKSVLEDNGIRCIIYGDDSLRASLAMGKGIELKVQAEDAEKAKILIKEAEGNGL